MSVSGDSSFFSALQITESILQLFEMLGYGMCCTAVIAWSMVVHNELILLCIKTHIVASYQCFHSTAHRAWGGSELLACREWNAYLLQIGCTNPMTGSVDGCVLAAASVENGVHQLILMNVSDM